MLIGTVSYLAPELVVDGRADARADVYAAGVVLYELLTGAKPHEGESPIQVAYKHVHEDVPPPSALVPGIPAYVDALVARATARDREPAPRRRRRAAAPAPPRQPRRWPTASSTTPSWRPTSPRDLLHADDRRRGAVGTEPPTRRERHRAGPVRRRAPWRALLRPLPARRRAHHRDRPAARAARPAAAAGGPPAADPDQPPPAARAGRRRGPLLLLLALLLVAGASASGAWWFGWARYTSTPAVLGLSQAAAERQARGGRPRRRGRRPGVLRDRARRAGARHRPGAGRAGARRRHGRRVVVSLGKERYDVPKLHGHDRGRGAGRAAQRRNLAFGKRRGRWSETVPEGTVIAQRPAGRHHAAARRHRRPRGQPGPPAGRACADWTGKDADRAEAGLTRQGLEVDRGDEEYSDTVAEGDVISQAPRDGTLFRGDTVELLVSRGPELVEVPGGLVAIRRRRRDRAARGARLRGGGRAGRRATSAWATCSRSTPAPGRWRPGSTITLYLI